MIEEIVNVDQPTIIEIVLYRNNWKDNQLIHTLKRNSNMFNINEKKDSFFVGVEDFNLCLEKFDKEIKKFDSISEDNLLDSVNSLYFLKNVFGVFENLHFIKVNISNKRLYTRVVQESISFSLKVVYSKVLLDSYLDPKNKRSIINVFEKIGIIRNDDRFEDTYVSIRLSNLISKIKLEYKHEKQAEILEVLFYIIDEKTEVDDPMILFIF